MDEEELGRLLRLIDHPLPRLDAEKVAARARARSARTQWRTRWTRVAAGIVLALGIGGIAYAAPGSPVPAWVDAAVAWMAGPRRAPAPAATVVPATPVPPAGQSGVAVAPGSRFVIEFAPVTIRGTVRVALIDEGEIVVRALVGRAVFTSDAERLLVEAGDSTVTFEVRIPRAAPRVEIRSGGARRWLKDGTHVTTDQPARVDGDYVIPLAPDDGG